jgi:insecticidal toxin complex protein TccC
MGKQTETQVLNRIAQGNNPTQAQYDKLLNKVGKGQSKRRARENTAVTENEFLNLVWPTLTPIQQTAVLQAITDYTQDSTAINNWLRGLPGAQDKSASVARIDQMFTYYANHNLNTQQRVVYRLGSWKNGAHVPYGYNGGAAGLHSINVGDVIRDPAYVSSSENRRLLVNGVQNPPPNTRYVKFVTIGQGGINISEKSQYNNANEQALHNLGAGGQNDNLLKQTKRAMTGPEAGQAEILFPRGFYFRVEAISTVGNDKHVRLSVPWPQVPVANAKNAFTGA